jgi:hypothetical protein
LGEKAARFSAGTRAGAPTRAGPGFILERGQKDGREEVIPLAHDRLPLVVSRLPFWTLVAPLVLKRRSQWKAFPKPR